MNIKISASVLKTIAVVLMVINHVCVFFMSRNGNGFLYDIIIAVTRASFVIFAFLLSEGMRHTRSREKYLMRLLIFALISEIPFDLFTYGVVFEYSKQNVFFDLAIAGLGIYLIDKNSGKYIKVLIGIAVAALATVIRADYAYMGVLLIFAFYYLESRKAIMYAAAALILFLCALPMGLSEALLQLCGVLAFVPIVLYDGTRGKQLPSLVYYWIYPVHLIMIWLIGTLV